jgi:hypothetical protein
MIGITAFGGYISRLRLLPEAVELVAQRDGQQ